MVSRGYAVVAINYRFSQHAVFPAQIHDCKAAVRWVRANAAKYKFDPERIAAWGSSAGGHLVALLGTTAQVEGLEGTDGNADQSSAVQAVVDWYGPTDFLTVGSKDTRIQLLGADPSTNSVPALRASPVTYVSKKSPPFLIMHGDNDRTVPLAQSEAFEAALKKAGVDAKLVILPGAGHGGPAFASAETMKMVKEFLDRHLQRR
jgi:acetyl esterase/lipase